VAEANGQTLVLDLAGHRVEAPAREGARVGADVSLVIRPEHVLLDKAGDGEGYNRLSARVTSESYQGPIIRAVLEAGGHPIVAEMQNRPDQPAPPVGQEMSIAWHPGSSQVLLD
jgi:ABC-type Fe3+/spermidine/putrescine transport system ATPase subunit